MESTQFPLMVVLPIFSIYYFPFLSFLPLSMQLLKFVVKSPLTNSNVPTNRTFYSLKWPLTVTVLPICYLRNFYKALPDAKFIFIQRYKLCQHLNLKRQAMILKYNLFYKFEISLNQILFVFTTCLKFTHCKKLLIIFENFMDNLTEKELQLQRKNKQLQQRKRQIQEQLKNLDQRDYEAQLMADTPQQIQQVEEKQSAQQQDDIIGQLQGVRKMQSQRNKQKLRQLKAKFEQNKLKIEQNNERVKKLQRNTHEAQAAVAIKNEMKKQLQSKGKKITEESRKWINQVSKLHDKSEQLKNQLNNYQKDEESLKNQIAGLEKKLNEFKKQKASYESEQKQMHIKLQNSKEEIQKAKQIVKEKELVNKEKMTKAQKDKQKTQLNHKRLQRQKNQLVKAYKKLNQYISLLRKTNLHLQTANSLNFTLKQYLQAIDRNDIIN